MNSLYPLEHNKVKLSSAWIFCKLLLFFAILWSPSWAPSCFRRQWDERGLEPGRGVPELPQGGRHHPRVGPGLQEEARECQRKLSFSSNKSKIIFLSTLSYQQFLVAWQTYIVSFIPYGQKYNIFVSKFEMTRRDKSVEDAESKFLGNCDST